MPTTAEIIAYPVEIEDKDKQKKVKVDHGAVHIDSEKGQVLVNKNKVMVKTPDGQIVQVKDGQVHISGKGGKVFNNGNTAPPANPMPNPSSIVSEIMAFVDNLLKSIFGK